MWTIAAAGLLSIAAIDVDVQPLSGDSWSGQLTTIGEDSVTIATADGPKTVKIDQIISLKPKKSALASEDEPTTWIRLLDGSQLRAKSFVVKDRKATIQLVAGGELEVPTRSIHHVRLRKQNDVMQAQWREIIAAKASGDLIVVRKTAESLDPLEGVVHDITAEKVQFQLEDDRIPVNRAKLDGIVYHSVGRRLPKPTCRVVNVDGNVWLTRSLKISGDGLAVRTSANVRHTLPINRLQLLDFSAGNIVYLSDVDPEAVRWTPFHGLKIASEGRMYAPQRNRGLLFDGEKLLLGNREYDKGLAVHSRTEITYRLTEEFKHFRTIAGIDDRVGDDGNVELIIYGDKRELFRKSLSGTDQPLPIHLNIEGVKRLRIFVDYGEKSDVADHLNLCQVRVTK